MPALREFGPYQLEYALGAGGVGSVFVARHAVLGRQVAVKVVRAPSDQMRARFLREARVQATLRHPNVLTVHDVLEEGADLAVVMDLVDGPDLGRWLQSQPPLALRLAVFRQVLAGVGAAHEKGLVHRDLKPANVLIELSAGVPLARVADFGLVLDERDVTPRITRAGALMGTPAYMAAEQIRDASTVDERADIFALGCVLYESVCGQMAFPQTDLFRLAQAAHNEDYADPERLVPGLPAPLVRLIHDCLRAEASQRPPSCAAVAERLAAAEDALGPALAIAVGSTPTAVPQNATLGPERGSIQPDRPVPRGRVTRQAVALSIAGAGLMLALGGAGWWAARGGGATSPQVDDADDPSPAPDPTVASAAPPVAEPPATPPAAPPPEEEPPASTTTTEPPAATEAPAEKESTPRRATTRVRFAGDARDAWLEANGRRWRAGSVPAGTYVVWATFGDDAATPKAAALTLTAGTSVTVSCRSTFDRCAVE